MISYKAQKGCKCLFSFENNEDRDAQSIPTESAFSISFSNDQPGYDDSAVKSPLNKPFLLRSQSWLINPTTLFKDLKKDYPGIVEYCQEHDCSFSEAIQDYQEKKGLNKWIHT